MSGRGGPKVLILYQITNVKGEGSSFNAFELPPGKAVSLVDVKTHCHALSRLNPSGANGYQWRVRVDDKVAKGAPPKYSWWDIQDENARLPVKEVSFTELSQIFASPRRTSAGADDKSSSVTRSLGKALNKVAASVDGGSAPAHHANFPRVPIVMFKLLDLAKLHDEFSSRSGHAAPPAPRRSRPAPRRPAPPAAAAAPVPAAAPQRQPAAPRRTPAPVRPARGQAPPARNAAAPRAKVQEGSLMDFGSSAPAPTPQPVHVRPTPAAPPTETRAERLKRQYQEKQKTENRVWDDVDQRWVAVDPKKGAAANKSTASAPPGGNASVSKTKLKAVSLDKVNLAGKSANVASAVQNRVNEMKSSQEKAVNEMREREAAKLKSEDEEDKVRQRLEPKIRAWSEEHGKKKQLRALLASMDKVLWPGAKWKPVNLGDLLEDKKVKLAFHKASRVVHPDKTMSLGPEERFIAKRIFDALSQAKTEFDNGK